MNATVPRSTHPWAATHRMLLALVAVGLVIAASVVIVLTTSAGSSSSSRVQAPEHGQTAHQIPGPAQPRGQGQTDIPNKCLQHMGLQYMALVPC